MVVGVRSKGSAVRMQQQSGICEQCMAWRSASGSKEICEHVSGDDGQRRVRAVRACPAKQSMSARARARAARGLCKGECECESESESESETVCVCVCARR